MDDYLHIVDNAAVQNGDWWSVPFRQFSYIFFCSLHALFGPSPFAFHLWTLGLHLAITIAIFCVGRRLLSNRSREAHRDDPDLGAFFAALIFACHPFLSEGVNYAQNASLQLVALFTILGVGATWRFVCAGEKSALAWVCVFVVLASASKEVGMFHAGLSALLVLAAFGKPAPLAKAFAGNRRSRITCALVAVAGVAVALKLVAFWSPFVAAIVKGPFWFRHFLTQGRLFWNYVAGFFWPANLCADHHLPFSGTWGDWEALIKTAAVLLLVIGIVCGAFFRRTRLACVLALLGLLPLLMRFLFVNKEFFVEYRAYSAMPWAALLAGWGLSRLHSWKEWPVRAAVVAIVITCTIVSARRSMLWGDRYSFAQDTIRKYPMNLRARTQLQKYDLEEGRWLSVMRRARECRAAMASIEQFNQRSPAGRTYELSMAFRCAMCSEHFYALALAETKGSAAALAHLTGTIEGLKTFNPDFVDPQKRDFEIGRQLVETRDILLNFGPAYDRLRSKPGDPAALAEINRLRDGERARLSQLP